MKHEFLRRIIALALCLLLALSLAVPSLAVEGDDNAGGNTESGNTEGGNTEGGNTEGGNTEGGNTEGGNTEGGNTEGGNTEGGNTEGGNTEGGNTEGGEEVEPNPNPPEPEQPGIKLDQTEVTLKLNQTGTATVTLTATTTPNPGQSVTWSSSNKDFTVTNGRVTAYATGTAIITAALASDPTVTATCKVTVGERDTVYVSSFSYPFAELQFNYSDKNERTITLEVYPSDAEYNGFSFDSDEESIVTIKGETSATGLDVRRDARLTAVGPGETYITATLNGRDGQTRINPVRRRVTVSGIVIYDSSGDKRLTDSMSNDGDRNPLPMVMGTSQNVILKTYGTDASKVSKVDWYSENNSVVSVTSGRLTPRSVGSTRITATRGSYSASFNVTVSENKTGLVEVTDSIPAGTPISFRGIRDKIASQFYNDTKGDNAAGKELYYVSSVSVNPSQGVLYYGYISEADTGSGIALWNRFYYSSSSPSDYLLSGLTFVPNSTFSGDAEISYTGVARDNTTVSGIIRIPVDAMDDVSYTTGSGQNVFFLGSDFNTICRLRTGRELASVTFTLPPSSRGTLYYNYTSEGQFAEKVEANTRYRRNGNPNLDSVSFLPADSFEGSVRISYRGTDTAGGTFTGYVTVNVTGRGSGDGADVRFSGRTGKNVSFTASRFNAACREVTDETLDYVQFTLPDSSAGTLYITSGGTERKVTEKTSYYRSGTPSIDSISFVPAKNAPDQIRIAYSGRSAGGTNFTGTVIIDYTGSGASQAIRYSVYSGRAVQFEAPDFNTACVEATGGTLEYVRFELPSASQGLLCYNYSNTASVSSINNSTRFYRSSGSGNSLDRVYFLADTRYTGTVSINYTGYSTEGDSFNGTVTVQVNSLAPAEVMFSGSGSRPIAMSSTQIRSACSPVMDKDLSYIQFTSLPSSSQGRLYTGYSGFETGNQVVTGVQYYVSGTPGIDQISFVPRGGFSGTAVANYTGVSTSGEQVSGRISFVVSNSGVSGYFSDMGGYSWAVPAADYLYQNGVITGVGDGQYAPGRNIQRCDFVVMLCRAYNFSGGSGSGFADVPSDSYYSSAVATARNLGIVTGDGNSFRPGDQLTRQDAMVIVKRTLEAAGWSLGGGSNSELSGFNDSGSVAAYAQDAVAALVRLGAVNGDGNGNLRPWDPITRAEAAVILHYVMTM